MTTPSQRCAQLVRYYRPVLAGALLLAGGLGYFSTKLKLRSDLDDLLPDSFPSVHAMNRMRAVAGGLSGLRLVLESRDFGALKRLAAALEPKLRANPRVKYVDYRNNAAFYRRNALLFLDPDELDSLHQAIQRTVDTQKQRLNPFLVDDLFSEPEPAAGGDELASWETKYQDLEPKEYNTNPDSTVLVLQVFPDQANTSLSQSRALLEDVRAILDSVDRSAYPADLQVYYGGSLKNRLDEFDVLRRDILGTAIYGVLGVFLLIALYFRHPAGALLVSFCLFLSVTWTFGVTYLVIGELNTITGFLIVILWGLGIDYGIHAFARYMESRRAGLTRDQAVDKMVCVTGRAIGTTALTTAVAFFTLLPMKFKGFSHLGFIAGVGVLFAFLAMVVVLPTLIIAAENLGLLRIKPAPHRAAAAAARRPFRFARSILVATVPLTALALYGFTRLGFEYDFTNLRVISEERKLVGEKTAGVFRLSESPALVMGDSVGDVQAIVAAVRQRIREDTLSPTIDAVRSVLSLVPEDQPLRLAKIRQIRTLVEEEAAGVLTGKDKERLDKLQGYLQVDRPFTWDDFPTEDRRQFLTKQGTVGNFVFIYPSVALRDGRNAIAFRDDIGTITTAGGLVFHAASSSIISADMLLIMVKEGRLAFLLTLGAVFLLVWRDFRKLRSALLVMTPLLIGFVWTGGLMDLLGLKLNFYNIVMLPSIIGIGVDNGVHIYHRYLEEGRDSLLVVLRHTGLALVMTTTTTLVGYSGLVLAHHPGLNSLGDLALIGISATFLTAVLVLPAILQALQRGRGPAEAGP